MYDAAKIDKLTGADQDRRRLLARYYSTLSEEDRVEAHRLAGELIRSMRGTGKMDESFLFDFNQSP